VGLKQAFEFKNNYYIQQMVPAVLKQARHHFLFYFVLQTLFLFVVLYGGCFLYHDRHKQLEMVKETKSLDLAPYIVTEHLETIYGDLFLLQKDALLNDWINHTDDVNRFQQLSRRILFFARSRAIYSQVRYLNGKGKEVLRINRNDDIIERVPPAKLQDKSGRYYFKTIKKMSPNELFLSRLDLNVEHGKVETPFAPTIRFGVPLFAANGDNRGAIVLNYDARHVLNRFKRQFVSSEKRVYHLVDYSGICMISPFVEKEWKPQHRFSVEHPRLWQIIKNSDSLQWEDPEGVYTVLSFTPLKWMKSHLPLKMNNVIVKGGEDDFLKGKLKVISFIPAKAMEFNFFSYLTLPLVVVFVLGQIIMAGIVWYYIRERCLKKFITRWMDFFFQGIEKNPASIVLTDQEGVVQYTNQKFLQLSGYTAPEVYLEHSRILKSGETDKEGYKELWDTISSGKTWRGEFHNKRKNDDRYWVLASISPIRDAKGNILQYLGVQEDISERKRLQQELEIQATEDPLTGLANRRSFFERFHLERERSLRGNHSFSVLMIDIDHFKKVNDDHGHQVGDLVLKDLGSLLKNRSRKMDIAARYGGEEFVIVLPEIKKANAVMLAERLRKDVEQHSVTCSGVRVSCTLSIGVAQWRADESLEGLLGRADQRLYQAKGNGRNCVVDTDSMVP